MHPGVWYSLGLYEYFFITRMGGDARFSMAHSHSKSLCVFLQSVASLSLKHVADCLYTLSEVLEEIPDRIGAPISSNEKTQFLGTFSERWSKLPWKRELNDLQLPGPFAGPSSFFCLTTPSSPGCYSISPYLPYNAAIIEHESNQIWKIVLLKLEQQTSSFLSIPWNWNRHAIIACNR